MVHRLAVVVVLVFLGAVPVAAAPIPLTASTGTMVRHIDTFGTPPLVVASVVTLPLAFDGTIQAVDPDRLYGVDGGVYLSPVDVYLTRGGLLTAHFDGPFEFRPGELWTIPLSLTYGVVREPPVWWLIIGAGFVVIVLGRLRHL